MGYPVTLTLSSILLASCACARALNPSLDVSHYAHDRWRVQEDGFTRARLTAIAQTPDGYLWLGTDFGLYRFDGARNVLWEPPPGQQLPSLMIWSLLSAHDGTLWIGTDKGLVSWKDGKLTHCEGLARFYIFTMLEDRGGTVWVGGIGNPTGRLCAIQTGNIHCYGEDGSFGTGVVGLYEDKQANLWAGVMNGLWRWKPGPAVFYPMPDALNSIRSFAEDDDGGLLFTTRSGIKRLMNGRIESYSLPGNLQQPRMMRMLRDRDGGLWLGTWNSGVIHVHQGRTDADPDGLTGVDVVALLEDREGNIWVVTSNGLDRFREPAVEIRPPPVLIEQITTDGRVYGARNGLRLPAHVRDLAIDYTALTLVTPEKIHFRYKLDGQDPNWREVVNDRQVQYSNLPPGDYHFRVNACNSTGVWNGAGTSLDFSIAPAYYQTTWFRLLCVAVFVGLLWALHQLRIHQVQREFHATIEARVDERIRIARDLHDTLLQSFHGLMLRLQVVSKLLPEGKAKEQLEKTMERADQAIAEGRNAVYELRSSAITTNDLAEAVDAVGNDLSADNNATFALVVEGSPRNLHPIIRDEFYRISREALHNAFKHAHARHIEAEIGYGDRVFRLRIRDDGEGIPGEILQQGRPGHYGLPGIREHARQVGAELSIWSRPGSGTEIELSLVGSIAYAKSPHRSRFRLFRERV